jgi:hypothetical protein
MHRKEQTSGTVAQSTGGGGAGVGAGEVKVMFSMGAGVVVGGGVVVVGGGVVSGGPGSAVGGGAVAGTVICSTTASRLAIVTTSSFDTVQHKSRSAISGRDWYCSDSK